MIRFWCQLASILVPKIHQKSTKNRSYGRLRRSWRPLGGVLGALEASWWRLGVSWAHLEASWRRLGASWRVLGASWGRLGGVLARKPSQHKPDSTWNGKRRSFSNDFRGSMWLSVALSLSLCPSLWLSIFPCGFLWLSFAPCGSLWPSVYRSRGRLGASWGRL